LAASIDNLGDDALIGITLLTMIDSFVVPFAERKKSGRIWKYVVIFLTENGNFKSL
jgi:hypothetical protein